MHKIRDSHIFFGGHCRSENWSQIVNMEGVIIKSKQKKIPQNFSVLGSMINCEKNGLLTMLFSSVIHVTRQMTAKIGTFDSTILRFLISKF